MDLPLESLEISIIEQTLRKKDLLAATYLEVGCGDGFNLERFSRLGMHGLGIDLSPEAIAIVLAKKLPGVLVRPGNFFTESQELPVAPRLIFMLNILEHIEEDKKFIERAFTILPPNGYLIIAVPANQRAFGFADENAGHLRRYDEQELLSKLKPAGFLIEEWFNVGFPVNRLYTWLFNFLNKKKFRQTNRSQTLTSGIRHKKAYYGGIFDVLAKLSFPILTVIIQIDRLFINTSLGNNFVVFAKKPA